jgi:microsomal dipeptidase-like Zn-dependent dipeptidase
VLVVGAVEPEVTPWLRAAGHVNTRAVRDAKEALGALEEDSADLVIVDREPSGLDAAGVVRVLRERLELIDPWLLAITVPAKGRGADADEGLTGFGRDAVRECERCGVIVDLAHINRRGFFDALELATLPPMVSHTGVLGVHEHWRNIDDEQIRACAARGGVIGLAPWGPLVLKAGRTAQPPLDDFIDHIDYVAQLTGSTDHIGIGTDMSLGTYPDHEHDPWGEPSFPDVSGTYGRLITADVRSPLRALDGFSNYTHVTNLIDRLGARGYSDDDIRKILGENYLRIFGQVWK